MKYQSQRFYPTEKSLSIVNDQIKVLSPEKGRISEWHESYVKNHKLRIALDLDIVNELVAKDANILEFGSIPLLFTAAAAKSGYRVTGVDIGPDRYKNTLTELDIAVHKCDIETERLPFADATFDAIVFNELFEHLRINPIFTLSEAFRVLKPGGIMTLSSPNLRSLDGIYNYLIKNRSHSCAGDIFEEYKKIETLGHMGHVREYTTTEVTEFLNAIGFHVTHIIYRGRFNSNLKQLVARIIPSIRPFVSYVATRPI